MNKKINKYIGYIWLYGTCSSFLFAYAIKYRFKKKQFELASKLINEEVNRIHLQWIVLK